ncbi:uncharacterized protein LOC142140025 [Mixophyes fleayi]|uniref:uncharacterized protein LOC142140025 n=1 Tax=Mixophyes fleayi TaxID=3061075 RepID=UPI003F4D8FD6
MEASLTCAVCLGVFREPVTLPLCSHNFCKSCVLDCAAPQSRAVYPQARDSYTTTTTSVSCPLCRKVSFLSGGLARLSVNTTIAEIVRHLSVTGESRKEQATSCKGLDLSPNEPGTGYCKDHPELKLELFCKNCAEPCCGKCVSSKHQGIFHNVNLLDMIYQEEKLMFFNSLKKLREVNEKLTKEVTDEDIESVQTNANMITTAFDEVQKALDLKKQQLLDSVKQQQSTAIKRSEVRKLTKAHYKKTVGSLLTDCEKIVDEFEPKCFLKVACDLNKRMKSSLDLMELSPDNSEDLLKSELYCVDLQAALDAISALKLTASNSNDCLTKINGNFSFKTITKTWKHEIVTNEKYCPILGHELHYLQGQMQKISIRFRSITEMPEYQHLSYEELRMKYYEESIIQESEVSLPEGQRPVVPNDAYQFKLRIAGVTEPKDSRLVRQDAVDGKRDTVSKTSTKTKLGKMHQEDKLSACMLKNPKKAPVKVQDSPKYFLGDWNSRASPDKVVKETKFGNETNSKNVFPSFCLGKPDVTAITTPSNNGRFGKKSKTAASLSIVKDGSVKSNFAMTNKPFDMLGNTAVSSDTKVTSSSFCNVFSLLQPQEPANEVPEDMSSEEYYDANSNVNSDVEETCEETNIRNNTDNESQTI